MNCDMLAQQVQFNLELSEKERSDRANVVLPFEHQGTLINSRHSPKVGIGLKFYLIHFDCLRFLHDES